MYLVEALWQGEHRERDHENLRAMCRWSFRQYLIRRSPRYGWIEDKFVDKFLEEDGSLKTGGMAEKATAAYHKVEDTVVGGYKKVENTFVDAFLEKVDEPESKDSEEKK